MGSRTRTYTYNGVRIFPDYKVWITFIFVDGAAIWSWHVPTQLLPVRILLQTVHSRYARNLTCLRSIRKDNWAVHRNLRSVQYNRAFVLVIPLFKFEGQDSWYEDWISSYSTWDFMYLSSSIRLDLGVQAVQLWERSGKDVLTEIIYYIHRSFCVSL